MTTYETAFQMAERLGVNPRTVQIWAKEGKLPGAIKHGRDWLIPSGLAKPDKTGYTQYIEKMPLPLFKGSFIPGEAHEFVASFSDEDMKLLAKMELLYVTGDSESAAIASEEFFNHHDIIIRLSACMVYAFSHLSAGHTTLAEIGLSTVKESIIREITSASPTPQFRAAYTIIYATVSVLMNEINYKDKLLEYIKYLPMGLQLWTGYILAHKAFIKKKFTEGVTTAEIFLSISPVLYPLPSIYLHLSAAMNLMALRKIDAAKEHFMKAWKLSEPDGFIMPFAECQSMLFGLMETCLKPINPVKYKQISELAEKYNIGWNSVYNKKSEKKVTNHLTTTEFAISMLASRGWSNIEIADYMRISLHTVKKYISVIYQKLNITSRSELKNFIH